MPISGKKVYLNLEERQFYCSDCSRYFYESFSFLDKSAHFTNRYRKHLYNQIVQSSINQVIAIEDICWKTANNLFVKEARKQIAISAKFKTVKYLGIDEFALKKGHKDFATVLVDLQRHCVLEILPYRQKAKLITFFKGKGEQWCSNIAVFCSDMWDGFINTAKETFLNAEIIVDRFHFFNQINTALDSQRKALRKSFKDEQSLKYSKWILLKNNQNLIHPEKQRLELALNFSQDLKNIYEAKENLRAIFEQKIEIKEAQKSIENWVEKVSNLNNRYLNRFLKTLNNWKEYVLNYFRTRLTTSIVEGINNKIKMIKRRAFGFNNFSNFRYRILAAFE